MEVGRPRASWEKWGGAGIPHVVRNDNSKNKGEGKNEGEGKNKDEGRNKGEGRNDRRLQRIRPSLAFCAGQTASNVPFVFQVEPQRIR